MANMVTCPNCGEIFEAPAKEKKAHGQLAGIALVDMTAEQLKREIINANSVLYKAKQRGASEEIIAKNQARVDAALAEKANRKPAEVNENPNVSDALGDVDVETAEEV